MWKLKNLEASHPRVAGIVQAHRQQIDAAWMGRQQMRSKYIENTKVPARAGGVKSAEEVKSS